MADTIPAQESLEAVLKDEIIRMYQDVAENPQAEYHFYHGREAAEMADQRRALEGQHVVAAAEPEAVEHVAQHAEAAAPLEQQREVARVAVETEQPLPRDLERLFEAEAQRAGV